jgi:hypothetical protein
MHNINRQLLSKSQATPHISTEPRTSGVNEPKRDHEVSAATRTIDTGQPAARRITLTRNMSPTSLEQQKNARVDAFLLRNFPTR